MLPQRADLPRCVHVHVHVHVQPRVVASVAVSCDPAVAISLAPTVHETDEPSPVPSLLTIGDQNKDAASLAADHLALGGGGGGGGVQETLDLRGQLGRQEDHCTIAHPHHFWLRLCILRLSTI
jgi:hypothetical protein